MERTAEKDSFENEIHTEKDAPSTTTEENKLRKDASDDLNSPFTAWQKIGILFVAISISVASFRSGNVHTLPSYLPRNSSLVVFRRTFQRLVNSLSYPMLALFLLDRPRVFRVRIRVSQFHGAKKQDEPFNEKVAQCLYILCVMTTQFVINSENKSRRPKPEWIYITGCILMLISMVASGMILRNNQFASTVIFAQKDQFIVKTGPYRYVRHPLYSCQIFYCVGTPLMKGSYYGILPGICFLGVSMWRTCHEEEFLIEKFGPKYLKYREEVPYRMYPGLF